MCSMYADMSSIYNLDLYLWNIIVCKKKVIELILHGNILIFKKLFSLMDNDINIYHGYLQGLWQPYLFLLRISISWMVMVYLSPLMECTFLDWFNNWMLTKTISKYTRLVMLYARRLIGDDCIKNIVFKAEWSIKTHERYKMIEILYIPHTCILSTKDSSVTFE